MNLRIIWGMFWLLFFVLVPVAWGADPSYPLEKGPVEPSIWANGKLVTGWEVPPRIEEGRLMAPVRLLATSMGAEVRWDEENQEVVVVTPKVEVRLRPGSSEALVNGRGEILPVPVWLQGGRVLAPVRFLAQALGWGVRWEGMGRAAYLTPPRQRVMADRFPARVAFTNDQHLWLLDGTRPAQEPVQVTHGGSVEILGWSPDGNWLAYLWRETQELYLDKAYLWVVKFDGSLSFQVDARPVLEGPCFGKPAWSPVENLLVYST